MKQKQVLDVTQIIVLQMRREARKKPLECNNKNTVIVININIKWKQPM